MKYFIENAKDFSKPCNEVMKKRAELIYSGQAVVQF
jgi:hypothetical protein